MKNNFYRVYRQEYRPGAQARVSFSVLKDDLALEFWYQEHSKDIKEKHPGLFQNPLGGVERHSVKSVYDGDSKHEGCFILGVPCHHDGSSLWADKFMPYRDDHGLIFTMLEKAHEEYHKDES